MADPEHLAKLRQGVGAWNLWRLENPDPSGAYLKEADLNEADLSLAHLMEADLREAGLRRANLKKADLRAADLRRANLRDADLSWANVKEADLTNTYLMGATLSGADLTQANLSRADLSGADLTGANLTGANLTSTVLRCADLTGANLNRASLIRSSFEEANLTGCNVYGISVWDAHLEGAIQSNLVITPAADESPIQVDNLEVAQFVYLLLNNEKIRHVIDTITSKVVLILGRFRPERKAVLNALRDELRERDYLPILFDFQKPESKDLTGTVTTLASMARFIIADLTDPSSVPHELATVLPITIVPVQPIVLVGKREYAMFADLKRRCHWVLEPYRYENQQTLLEHLGNGVIAPAEAKVKELRRPLL